MNYEQFCSQFTEHVPKAHVVGDRYYLVNEDVAKFKSGEQRKPHAMGMYLGMGKKFVPTPALLRILAKQSTRKATITDDRAEWLFLCGRDIFPEFYNSPFSDGFVLVQNKHDENLGLATFALDGKKGIILKNVLDRGNYLRHEKVCIDC